MDVRNLYLQLCSQLKTAGYECSIDQRGLCAGIPQCVIPLLQHALLGAYQSVGVNLLQKGYNLKVLRDTKFVESVYKVLRDEFGYKPLISQKQFFQNGFAARKISLITDVFRLMRSMHFDLMRRSKLLPTKRNDENELCPKPRPPVFQEDPVLESLLKIEKTVKALCERMDKIEETQVKLAFNQPNQPNQISKPINKLKTQMEEAQELKARIAERLSQTSKVLESRR